MSRSMMINEVLCGAFAYADQVACSENDPVNILMAQEADEETADYPSQSLVIEHYCLTRSGP